MWHSLLSKIVGDPNEKEIQRLQPIVEDINALEPTYVWMTSEELRRQTDTLKTRLQQGESLDDVLPDAFALVREAAKRTVGMRHFDVQLIGGIVLHQGKVAEMKTGEGKTLVATLPVCFNALVGSGVHLVTVNDYLARRDAVWMGPIYHLLGLKVGLLQQSNKSYLYDPGHTKSEYKDLRAVSRREAYAADITYGTNHEFGFDYLRDNLAYSVDEQVQRPLHYAIVDEVDNVFIDEARTPLIISGAAEESDEDYRRFARIAPRLDQGVDYELDPKTRAVYLTEAGLAKVEELVNIDNIYDPVNQRYVHFMEQALKAHVLFHEGRDYIRQRDRIVLVDEFTGRLMPDRRLSDGLHQAIEAKHGLRVRARMVTQATITIQNYFRMYPKLAGMTGTALSEAEELHKIYHLEVLAIPTHKQVIREDAPDVVYRTAEAKMTRLVEEIKDAHERGQPVLVGTTSVEKSEELSRRLRATRIEHHVLNAKEHTNEARIVAGAGEPGRVTVATNMAGRGVDIKLGGELPDETVEMAQRVLRARGIDPFVATPEQFDTAVAEVDPSYALRRERVIDSGGLYVLGTERHEARRIDNQLRGRSGRQGEPGLSRFFLSLEDDLMRRFGGSNISNLMSRLGVEDDMPIEHKLVSRSIESAQSRVEGYNFDIRKHLLEYDDVLNQQREMIYGQRQRILTKDDLWPDLWAMVDAELEERCQELSSQPGRVWELVNFLDVLVPVSYAPVELQKGAKGRRGKMGAGPLAYEKMKYPYVLSDVRSIFLPFTLSFLAGGLVELAPKERMARLVSVAERGVDLYREYVLDQAIGESFARGSARYDEGMEQLKDLLEQRIMTYMGMIEERDRAFNPREMIDQVQRGLPVRITLPPTDLSDLDVDEVRDILQQALEQSHHISMCEQLVQRVAAQVPAALGLADAQMDLLDAVEIEYILDKAEITAYSEDSRQRIQQMAETGSSKRPSERGLFKWLSTLLGLSRLDLGELEKILAEVISQQYDAWAERILHDFRQLVDQNPSGNTEIAIGQWLLSLFALVDPKTFQLNWRFPPAFLVLASVDGLGLEDQVAAYRAALPRFVSLRQGVWGEANMVRYGALRMEEMGDSYIEALARFYGRQFVGGSDTAVAGLSQEHENILHRVALVHDLRDLQMGTWPMFDQLVTHVSRSIERRLVPQHGEADPYLIEVVERRLMQTGWFDDPEAEARILQQRVEDLGKAEREEIASYVGEAILLQLRDCKVRDLDPSLQQHVYRIMRAKGRFTDERQLQDFLLHQKLEDIGSEAAVAACRHLVQEQLERHKGRAIQELEVSMRDQVMAGLRAGGYLWDEGRKRHTSEQPIRELDESVQNALALSLGDEVWPKDVLARDLGSEEQELVRQLMDEAGLFLMRDRFNGFSLTDLRGLKGDISRELKDFLSERLMAALDQREIMHLPKGISQRVRRILEAQGFFTDAGKMAQFEQRSIASLEGKVVTSVERALGRQMLAEVDKRKFINLDKEMRERILHYLDRENIYRKSSKRRAFMQRPLEELDASLYDGIAEYLGREVLGAVRAQPIGQLEQELKTQLLAAAQDSGELLDADKLEAFERGRLDDLSEEMQSLLIAQLQEDLGALFEGVDSEMELYDGMLMDARQFLAGRGYFDREGADEEFLLLSPASLQPALRERVYLTLGRKVLEPLYDQALGEIPASQRARLVEALHRTDVLIDRAKQNQFLNTRIQDLPSDRRQAVASEWARILYQEIKEQPVATLREETRQSLRTFLDNSGHFVDERLIRVVEELPLAELRREDWQTLAETLGDQKLTAQYGKKLSELDSDVRQQILAFLRTKGMFLDERRRTEFKQEGLACLTAEVRDKVLQWAEEAERERLRTRTLSSLAMPLRWAVEHAAIDVAPPADYGMIRDLEKKALSELDPQLYDAFLRYLGYAAAESIRQQRLSSLPEQERRMVRDFLGDRVFFELQKRVMLGFVSRLWIDYLTDMEDLRQGIGLQAFGQRDPLVEYKRRAYHMFQELMKEIRQGIISRMLALEPVDLPLASAG